jgi:thioredoxin 1
MSKVIIVENNSMEDVLAMKDVVVAKFRAEWCGPCKTIEPVIKQIAEEMADQVAVAEIDIAANPILAAQMGVRSVPTVLILKNGETVEQIMNANSKEFYMEKINAHVN